MTREDKLAHLVDAIGDIDDRYIEEARAFQPRRRALPARRVLALAASLVLTFAIVIAALLGQNGLGGNTPPPGGGNQGGAGDTGDDGTVTVEKLLADATATATPLADQSEIPFFDGHAYLVWQFEGEDVLYMSHALTQREVNALLNEYGKGTSVGTASPHLTFRLWLVRDDGTVISPYLNKSDGNISRGCLFDYEAEILPTDSFLSDLAGIFS